MTSQYDAAIEALREEVRKQEEEIVRLKGTVNTLCARAGRPPLYAETELGASASVGVIRPDQFYGKPLATAVRDYLAYRKATGLNTASVNEIHDALVVGGFAFETPNVANRKRNLRISLSKNSTTFHRLPNGGYGLLEWYPAAKGSKAEKAAKKHATKKPPMKGTPEEPPPPHRNAAGGNPPAARAHA
jgi:hypothetical protein